MNKIYVLYEINSDELVPEMKTNSTGICDKHRLSYRLKDYPLGCPCCYKNDYLDRGYVLDGFQIPVLEILS